MSEDLVDEPSKLTVQCYFVRGRNALLVRAKMEPLFIDYYLHLMEQGIQPERDHDLMLKDALAAMALHTASRPQDETTAWTIHFEKPRINLFVTGSTHPGWVSGRIFTEDVREMGKGLFTSQVKRVDHTARQSMVDFHGMGVLETVEHFYNQSEQRVTRLFQGDEEEMILITAQPDCDEEWLLSLTYEELEMLPETHTLTLLETREFAFHCGCSLEKLFPLIARLPQEDLDYIFEDGFAKMTCPRCAAVFTADRAAFDLWQSQA
jgi:molecular chaperone Hsp33